MSIPQIEKKITRSLPSPLVASRLPVGSSARRIFGRGAVAVPMPRGVVAPHQTFGWGNGPLGQQPDSVQPFPLGERHLAPASSKRRGHVLQSGHGRNEVERTKDHPILSTAKQGELVFVHGGKRLIQSDDLP